MLGWFPGLLDREKFRQDVRRVETNRLTVANLAITLGGLRHE